MRILITGSRDFLDYELMKNTLKKYKGKNATIIHGACRGADLTADFVAKKFGFNVEKYPANWQKYGKSAGPIRNKEMLESDIDLVLAFPIGESKGTRNCISQAKAKNIPVIIIEKG